MLQTVLITLHNISRWLVLVFGILAAARAFSGWRGKKAWTPADDRAGLLFTSLLDLQLLFGLVLYFTSPFMAPRKSTMKKKNRPCLDEASFR